MEKGYPDAACDLPVCSMKHDIESLNQSRWSFWPPKRYHVAVAALVAIWIALPTAVCVNHGMSGLEKLLTRYAMPVGLIWHVCLLGFLIEWIRKKRFSTLCLGAAFTLITVTGSEPFSAWFNSKVEYSAEKYSAEKHSAEEQIPLPSSPLDTTVLLGGSTRVDRRGVPELAIDGHRLFYAAQIYHAGKTQRILVTGSNHSMSGEQISPAQQAKQLLISIGVPADRIDVSAGNNTREEIHELAKYFQQDGQRGKRIGLITNATHLGRAMRLAKGSNLKLEPLPCVYRGGPVQLTLLNLVPCATGLYANTDACYEWLAKLAGQ